MDDFDDIIDLNKKTKSLKSKIKQVKERTISSLLKQNKDIPSKWMNERENQTILKSIFKKDDQLINYFSSSDLKAQSNFNNKPRKHKKTNNNISGLWERTYYKLNQDKEYKKAFRLIEDSNNKMTNLTYKTYNRPQTSSQIEVYSRIKKSFYEKEANLKMSQTKTFSNFKKEIIEKDIERPISAFENLDKMRKKLLTSKLNLNFNPFLNEEKDFQINKAKKPVPIVNQLEKVNLLKSNELNKCFEEINKFGPYYSHCLVCAKNNSCFYNSMNEDKAVVLMKEMKKVREKKVREKKESRTISN